MARRRQSSDSPRSRGKPEPLVSQPSKRSGGSRRGSDPAPRRKRSRAARNPIVIVLNLFMLLAVMGLLGGGALAYWGYNTYHEAGPLQQDIGVNIDRGASVGDIARGLEGGGVISNRYVFQVAAVREGATTRLQAGEYRIPAGSSMKDVLEALTSGNVVQHRITIPEGLTSAQVVSLLENNTVLSGEIAAIPDEGSLLPETYQFSRGMSRARMIELMQGAMDRAVAQAWENRDPSIPVESPEDMVVLASIVEKETGVAGERPRVAAVFTNRLEQGMRLQSDPTILYGLHGGDAWRQARTIFRSDLERPNPYNTYQINGLPPGPIANPGRAALEAVARPADTNERFFVADGTGGHAFSVTYEEHQQNVAKWREIEAQRNGQSN